MNYTLRKAAGPTGADTGVAQALRTMAPLVANEWKSIGIAGVAITVNSIMNLVAPIIVGKAVDKYIVTGQYHGVLVLSGALLAVFAGALVASYIQTRVMGGVGQRVLFNLRNAIFTKLQSLPVAFFNQNKAGDLISRINNDTDKLNQFFSQSLMQFVGSIFIMVGAGISLVSLSPKLGGFTLMPALLVIVFTQVISPWVKKRNAISLESTGGLSGEIQESLDNFKVIVAFNRSDYFRESFSRANDQNYNVAVKAGLANNLFVPFYALASMLGQLVVLAYGIYLIGQGQFTIGLLITFLTYVMRFYDPLRQLAALWSSFQVALAGWDRVSEILSLGTDLVVSEGSTEKGNGLLEFRDVSFGYPHGRPVLSAVNFTLEAGKTYALVGPTGGGKTTTASLMARLYDPTAGTVFLSGKDLRSYEPEARAKKIGFILQEPFLFTGSVRDNILYGNEQYEHCTNEQLQNVIHDARLVTLLERFDEGLDTKVTATGDGISLGQKQLIAFIRAVLRRPDLLILDEATANIDTVTEQLLEDILAHLPEQTTRVIIAHRLNTIANADEIFFVNGGGLTQAGSMEHALELLLHGKRSS